MLFIITSLAVLFGFCSLAVDLGRAETAKTELCRVAEAAARAAAYQLEIGGNVTAIQNAATAMVTHNPVDGSTLTIVPSTDVQLLSWTSSSNYSVVSTTAAANAVRVYARRATSAGTPITLMFATVLGKSSVDVVASSVAQVYSTSADVTIPATGNPWLSGEPNGTQASIPDADYPDADHWQQYDLGGSTEESPTQVGLTLVAGSTIQVSNVSGQARKSPTDPYYGATGSGAAEDDDAATVTTAPGYTGPGNSNSASTATGSEHGLASINTPGDSIVGVFLDANLPDGEGTPPPGLDFTTAASQEYTSFSAQTRQPFYVGNGLENGTQQSIIVPASATRFYLGIMDGHEWSNNAGSFSATITQTYIQTVQ